MALQDTLSELVGKAPATKNRVDLLLSKLEAAGSDDHDTLLAALRDKGLRPATLTKAIRKEYGIATVTDTSVAHWRAKNLAEVNGL